jgi:hypothetical protein
LTTAAIGFAAVFTGVGAAVVLAFAGVVLIASTFVFTCAFVPGVPDAGLVFVRDAATALVFAIVLVFADRAGAATALAFSILDEFCPFFAPVLARFAVAAALLAAGFFTTRAVLRAAVAFLAVSTRVGDAAFVFEGDAFLGAALVTAAGPRADAVFLSFGAGRAVAFPLFRDWDRSVLLEPALALVDLSVFLTDDIRGALLFCSALETERIPSWPVMRTATLRSQPCYKASNGFRQ